VNPVKLLVVGAGGRGSGYATFANSFPDKARIVGVAEPRDHYRDTLAQTHAIPADGVFKDWREAAARERFADAVLICTQDAMHLETSIAFARKGYHILLEKPMAPDEESCRKIVAAAKEAGVIFTVCYVMRYTNYTRGLKRILDEGRIGTIVSMQHRHQSVSNPCSASNPPIRQPIRARCKIYDRIHLYVRPSCTA
jgi:predicted dehydrogenase